MKKAFFIFMIAVCLGCNDGGEDDNGNSGTCIDCDSDSNFCTDADSGQVDTDTNPVFDTDWIDDLKAMCEGVVCDNPPEDACLDRHRLQKYDFGGGWCLAGECIFSWKIEECYICNNSDEFGAYCFR